MLKYDLFPVSVCHTQHWWSGMLNEISWHVCISPHPSIFNCRVTGNPLLPHSGTVSVNGFEIEDNTMQKGQQNVRYSFINV